MYNYDVCEYYTHIHTTFIPTTHINTEATEKLDTDILLFSLASHILDREPLYSHKAIDYN